MVKVLDRESINRMTRNSGRGGSTYVGSGGGGSYTLPVAADGTLGGVQLGYTTDATARKYAVQLDGEKAYVNVPWTSVSFGTDGNDYVPITIGSATKNVLTAHQSLYGYATESWVTQRGYATQSWVNQNFITVEWFDKLFKLYNGAESDANKIAPNGTLPSDPANLNIEAMFGFWTKKYISSLGQGDDGTTSYTTLAQLNDVTLTNPTADQVLTYNGTHWVNRTLSLGSQTLAGLSDVAITTPSANQMLGYDATTQKWKNIAIPATGVTSVALSMPTGFSITGSPITASGTFTVTFASGYSLPTTAKQSNWDTAYGWGDHADAGYASASSLSNYLPLSGGTMNGSIHLNNVGIRDGVGNWIVGKAEDANKNGFYILCTTLQTQLVAIRNSYTTFLVDSNGTIDAITGNSGEFRIRIDSVNSKSYVFNSSFFSTFSEGNGLVNLGRDIARWNNVYCNNVVAGTSNGNYVQIGTIRLVYDSGNNAIKVVKNDGSNANLYATGGLSALGAGQESGGNVYLPLSGGTMTGSIRLNNVGIRDGVGNWIVGKEEDANNNGLVSLGTTQQTQPVAIRNIYSTFMVDSNGTIDAITGNSGEFRIRLNGNDSSSYTFNTSFFSTFGDGNGLVDNGRSTARWKTYYGNNIDIYGDGTLITLKRNMYGGAFMDFFALNQSSYGWRLGSSSELKFFVTYSADGFSTDTWRLMIDTSGNVGIGTSLPSYKLHVAGTVGATGFTNTSDIRKKNRIKDVDLRLDQIAKAPTFEYYWLDPSIDHDLHVGTSAQYWESVLPQVVTTAKDEIGTKAMQYGVAALISAITVARKVMTHEEKIALLETRVSALEKENCEQEQLINSLQEELAKFKAA